MLADDVPGDRLNSQRRNVRASGPANASASATNPNHPTRTCKHLEPDLLLHAPWWHHHTGKKAIAIRGSYRDIDEAYLLQRPLPATTVAQRAASRFTTHAITTATARFAQPAPACPLATPPKAQVDHRSSSAVDRRTLFARLGPQRRTADCSAVVSPQNATTRTWNRSTGEISPRRCSQPCDICGM